jgi:hypothetical protein
MASAIRIKRLVARGWVSVIDVLDIYHILMM